MTKIMELAHALGEEIAASIELKSLENAKAAYEADEKLQALLSEYETERELLGQQFSGEEQDEEVISKIKARMDELSRVIIENPRYMVFTNARRALDELMAEVNAEIKFCITGERPAACTHDCSTCGGCSSH